ncbi:hypothetical protein BMF94_2457 [Rhodotorula taiwanensis]|uniref:Uncharacterized protein n=1 Tax=Rhodotorula taiwanensis TaxID=741276 RepID=A0A2S5BCF1_9BASI|nr:hypothetical protein BMF94_2457 [Rhodotorula taiwanensis]
MAPTQTAASTSTSASGRGAPQRPAPYPLGETDRSQTRRRRRVSSLAADPALDTLGALYVGWAQGERDPAPLCCPQRAKQSLVRKYGNAAVGSYSDSVQSFVNSATSVHARAKQPHLDHPPSSAGLQESGSSGDARAHANYGQTAVPSSLPLGSLPPLPLAPVHYVGGAFDFLPSARIEPALALPPLAPQPSFDAAFSMPSTPPECTAGAPSMLATPSLPTFDACEFLDASLALFQSASQPPSPILLLPSLPNLDAHSQQQAPPPPPPQFSFDLKDFTSVQRKLETVPEDDYDESLFSSGESAIGSSSATDVMSEAGWAW